MSESHLSSKKRSLAARIEVAAQGHLGADELWELVRDCAAEIDRLRKELNEEVREGNRAARDAYSEGRWDEREEQRQW